MKRHLAIAVVISATALTGGVSGSVARAAVVAKKVAACSLLTADEVGTALAGTADAGQASGPGTCRWTVTRTAGTSTSFDTVTLYLFDLDSSAQKDVTNASKKSTAKKLKIAGASIAFYDLSGSPIARVVKKKQFLTLQLSTQQGDDVIAAAMKKLTTQAAKRF